MAGGKELSVKNLLPGIGMGIGILVGYPMGIIGGIGGAFVGWGIGRGIVYVVEESGQETESTGETNP